jgi:phospholipid/cholesterol/gamma-HCH transport system substrate-binding protein
MARTRQGGLHWSEVRVGAVILVALVVLAYATVSVGKLLNMFNKRYELVTLLPTAAGLPKGAQVTVAGQRVGQVDQIEFLEIPKKTRGNNILVRMKISQDIQEQIRRDSKVQLRTTGLLGDKYIDITPGSGGTAILQEGDTLESLPPTDFDQLLASAAETLDQARNAITQVRGMTSSVARGEGTLGRFVADEQLYTTMLGSTTELRTMLHDINTSNGTFGQLVRDPTVYRRLNAALGRMDSLTIAILHGNGSLAQLLNNDSLYRGLAGTVNRADEAVASLSTMIGRMNQGQGTMQKLFADPALYDQLLKSVVDVQTLIADVRRDPERYKPNIDVNILSKVNKVAPPDTAQPK